MAGQEVHMRVWRGNVTGGEFKDYRLTTGEGMVVLERHSRHSSDPSRRSGGALELQSRQMRLM